MDDAARLVSELHGKLAELDGKVAAYQRDMMAEFHRHMDDCLQKYPDHVSEQVSRAIAESMSAGRYPALSPPARSAPGSPALSHKPWDGRKSPPPILPHTSGTPKEVSRSPHAREKEFQGVFTPAYLPLLEVDRGYSSPPMSPPPTSGDATVLLSSDNLNEASRRHKPNPAQREGRPLTLQLSANRSTSSSISSSTSESGARKSALRRSSSSAKGSPRRVRFEVEGQELFPSVDEAESPTVTPIAESGAKSPVEAEAPAPATEDESTQYKGLSLLDVEGEEDLLPKPRKVSSTQRLQALTRSLIEDASAWIQVNPSADAAAKMNGVKQPETAQDVPGTTTTPRAAEDAYEEPGDGQLGTPIEEQAVYDDDDATASDEEEFLSMKPKPKSPSPAARTPFTKPTPSPRTTSTASTSHTNGNVAADDDDALFDFDEEAGQSTPQSSTQPQKYLSETDSDDEDSTPGRLRKEAREKGSETPTGKIPPVSPSTVLFGHSIGSYMGRSMTINPIKDPKLYDEIANMKDVPLFVGSIDGRTGVDTADPASYRASSVAKGAAGGVPKSFTERLALEEEMERRRRAGEGSDA